tara:strand:- start:1306 stop:2007 length:702 start_codon:yes stop_codon:yes gene_type:complete
MSSFTEFQNILPDPNYGIGDAGQSGTSKGPGFASVKLSSERPIMRNRTNSGRTISRAQMYHKWNISITYNELTREEFDPVYSFLMEKQGSLKPFFVSLPQYREQIADMLCGTASAGSNIISTVVDIEAPLDVVKPGFLFTVADPSDSTHVKAYTVVRVENNTNYLVGSRPTVGIQKITISPSLSKNIVGTDGVSGLIFTNPLIQVIQTGDIQEYSLGNTGLYNFSLQLEEALY